VPKLKVKVYLIRPLLSPCAAHGMRDISKNVTTDGQAADPPVRANVLYLDPEFATVIS
jgi:hypothetical protein